jgi:hypothetical protein
MSAHQKSAISKRNSPGGLRWTSKTKPRIKHVKLGVKMLRQIRTLERLLKQGPFQLGPYQDVVGAFLGAVSPILTYRLEQGGPHCDEASVREYRDRLIATLRAKKPWIRIVKQAG